MKHLTDKIGQKLDVDDLVVVVWANGGLTPARIIGFNRKFHMVNGHRQPFISEARVVVEGGSKKWKRGSQMVKIDKITSLDGDGEVVLH